MTIDNWGTIGGLIVPSRVNQLMLNRLVDQLVLEVEIK